MKPTDLTSLTQPWLPLQTNTLTTTNWLYTDPDAARSNASFYRALWLK
jgi:hypothetical protein